MHNATNDVNLQEIVRDVLRLATDLDLNRTRPWIGQLIQRRLQELTGVVDPYQEAKTRFNRLALSVLSELRQRMEQDPNPLVAKAKAAKAAKAAIVIDLVVKSQLNEIRAANRLRESSSAKVHGDVAWFQRRADAAQEILDFAGNARKTVAARLLIEKLAPERVTLAVRGKAVINDATIGDSRAAKLRGLMRIIDNGSDAPRTILNDCSGAFLERFNTADPIVSKCQGNCRTLRECEANIVFLLRVKCPVITTHVGLQLGTSALVHAFKSRTLTMTLGDRREL